VIEYRERYPGLPRPGNRPTDELELEEKEEIKRMQRGKELTKSFRTF